MFHNISGYKAVLITKIVYMMAFLLTYFISISFVIWIKCLIFAAD